MGTHTVKPLDTVQERSIYFHRLLTDIEALEEMLQKGMFLKEPIHIGAEQEFCLVNRNWEPSNKAMKILADIEDPHFTSELTLYNLEINLDPRPLEGTCFSDMHRQLNTLLDYGQEIAEKHGNYVILTGILPTISTYYLSEDYMTPKERYKILSDAIQKVRKSDLEVHIKGVDEINLHHDSWQWIHEMPTNRTTVLNRYNALWTQIAAAFRDHSPRLHFESVNEPQFANSSGDAQNAELLHELSDDSAAAIGRVLPRIARAVLVGQSMGGYIAQQVYLRHPARVAAMVIIGAGSLTMPYSWLDITLLGKQHIDKRLREVREICRYFLGIDPARDLIPVRPAQHYSMGGVRTDHRGESPTLRGLFACGEAACWDMHGFNRLGGNSLSETIVTGRVVGRSVAAGPAYRCADRFPRPRGCGGRQLAQRALAHPARHRQLLP